MMSTRKRRLRGHQRNWGKTSPIDNLPAPVLAALRARFSTSATLAQLCAWLKAEHGFHTSATSLSDWGLRERERAAVSLSSSADFREMLSGAGVELAITTPRPGELRVQVRPIAEDDATAAQTV